MRAYIQSETMKFKHTFSKKLIIIVPIILAIIAFLMGGFYWYQVLSVYWWYAFLMPGTIALFCALSNQKEERAVKYYSVFSMPINLRRFWRCKAFVVGMFLAELGLILFVVANIAKLIAPSLVQFSVLQVLLGVVTITLTSLWQIPLCMFLAKKFSLVIAVVFNSILGILLPILIPTNLWWVCPYNWTHHSIEVALGIETSGVLGNSSLSINGYQILVAIILSIALFTVISLLGERWFERQEAR